MKNFEEENTVEGAKKNFNFHVSNKILKNILTKLLTVAAIYLVFYYQFSFFWILCLVTFRALEEEKKSRNEKNHHTKRVACLIDEKEAVMARLKELPSWVIFPDVDRAEWLNKIIKDLWPNVNTYFVKMLRNTIQPKIKKKFESFRFEEIELGYAAPRIDGVKVYDTNSKSEIIIDFNIFYDGDCDIDFYIYGTYGCIKDMQMVAVMRVVLKPIITKMPLIGGVQIFFLNNPKIDMVLEGIASIPGLGYYIKKKILKTLSKKMVFPNKIPVKLSKSVDSADLKWIEPDGVLRVHVIEASDLERKDMNVLGVGKSDPYAVLSVGAQEYKTKVINNTTEPKWDFWCEFIILDPTVQHLNIEVSDWDYKSHDFLGRATIDLSTIVHRGQDDQWVQLQNVKHGKIHLRLMWLTLSSNYSDLKMAIEEKRLLEVQEMSTALLAVYVESATGLPQAKASRNPDPYTILTVGNISLRSKVKKNTTNPVWEQGFTFLLSNPESNTLYLTIVDKYTGQTLDQVNYKIDNLAHKENMEVTREELRLTKGDSNSTLIISLRLKILQTNTENDSEDETSSDEDFCVQPEKSDTTSEFITSESKRDLEEIIQKSSSTPSTTSPVVSVENNQWLGSIEITLRYSIPRQKLIVVIHKISKLPLKNPTDIPDPYVKLQLIPEAEKHKTRVITDNCNPVYDEAFEFLICESELHKQKLVITVKTRTKFLLSNRTIGQVVIDLNEMNILQPLYGWFDLMPANLYK